MEIIYNKLKTSNEVFFYCPENFRFNLFSKKLNPIHKNPLVAELLKINGFEKYQLPDTCPSCYTIRDFCDDYPTGTYVVGTGEHVVCVINGNYFDSWDSGNEIPIYYFKRR